MTLNHSKSKITQKCSAVSRAYIPESLWPEVKKQLLDNIQDFKMGSPGDPKNFMTAVIDERSFDKIAAFIDDSKQQDDADILTGGSYDKSKGYFIDPVVVHTSNPHFRTMCEEIFGPFLTIHTYPDADWTKTLALVDSTSQYALTGAVFSLDRYAINEALEALTFSAGNFYINDKPSGAVVGQQPFGGGRGSGTNDKAGSAQNLLRWVSPRTIKETLLPAKSYPYPYMD